ncbi:hypothetical protein [uncultured Alistipes sp.]|mgnify:FL=1|uniref:hypothetical protein n=1 Tax=uncultured Alistipes sp. TaxID=538949 RepID=UPI002610B600|nr:hypothetical protein [uncultured Alistipes sp.]
MKIVIKLFGIVLLMLVSCTRDPADTRPRNEAPGALSVEEARRFFEDRAERTFQLTRTGIHPRGFRGLNPGEFTPNWEKALSSQYRKLASIDVPIASECRFQAVRSRFRNGEAEIFRVDITQKLVVVKDLATDSLGCYILTLIPDPYYAARHKKTDLCEEFLNAGDKGEFSGVAIYTEPTSGILIRVSRYRNGLKTAGVYVPGPPSERKERIRLAKKLIGSVRIGRTVSVSTRSWGEDDWWWDDDDYDDDYDNDDDDYDDNDISDSWTDLGLGLFEDGCYHQTWLDEDGFGYWVDYDDDGHPDRYIHLLDPDPDDPTNDPPYEPDDDFCPFCGGSPCSCSDPCPICGSDPCSCPEDDSSFNETDNNCAQCGNNPCTCNQDTHKTTAGKLTSAAKKGVEIVTAKYGTVKAYCNQGVREAFHAAFNKELPNVNANELIKHMKNSSEWGKLNVSMSEIQNLANQGHFIVASWVNTSGGSGHVALVVPGEMQGGTWCGEWIALPVVMDTGAECREESQKLSKSFGTNKHSQVEFYIYE